MRRMPSRASFAAAVLAVSLTACAGAKGPYQAQAPVGPPALDREHAAKLLVLVAGDPDPQTSAVWRERLDRAVDAVEADLKAAGYRTTREVLASWSARVTVSCPIRGADFAVFLQAKHKPVDHLEANGLEWGAPELAALARTTRQRLERSPHIAALAGVQVAPPAAPEPSAVTTGSRAAVPPAPAAEPPWRKVASGPGTKHRLVVADFGGSVPPSVLGLLADLARAAAVEAARTAGVSVMTREGVTAARRASGQSVAACSDGACALETARLVGADLVLTGEVSQVGGAQILVLKLLDVSSGALLASKHARAADDLALVDAAKPAAAALFE